MKSMMWFRAGVLALIASVAIGAPAVFAAEVPQSASCAAPAYRQFDFWAGDWDAFDVGSTTRSAQVRVDLILDGCVLREDYQGADGHKGQSFTVYDVGRKVWHQSWVTNRGEMLEIEGNFEAGEIVLTGEDHAAGGLVRGTWKAVEGGVRETAVTSADGGKTWKPWFDLMFRPASGAADKSADADKSAIAALDNQYQAAVKANDAGTMARILADEFILVTGSGKVYSKADLLAEARGGHMQYEHQEDTEQTVRVFGNTAVITARLWEKGTDSGKGFDSILWFSDTYVRTPSGWSYVFGQASRGLDPESSMH